MHIEYSYCSAFKVAGLNLHIENIYAPNSVTRGSQLRFPCSAVGTPTPTILWRKNRLTIVENLKTSILPSGTLILNDFDDSDDGIYMCSAFNDHGFITAPQVVIRGNRITVTQEENQITVENELITDAFRRAKGEVEQAEQDSVDLLFSNSSRNGMYENPPPPLACHHVMQSFLIFQRGSPLYFLLMHASLSTCENIL